MAVTAAYQLFLDASQFIAETQRANSTMIKFNQTQVSTNLQMQAAMHATGLAALSLGKSFAIMGAVGIAATGIAFAAGVAIASDYAETLSRIEFWTDATEEEMRNLNAQVLKMSSFWGISAKELMANAEAFAKIDMRVTELDDALNAVAMTVTATGEDIADITHLITIAYESWGVQVEDLTDMLSKFTYIAKRTSLDVGDIGKTLAEAGGLAQFTGVNMYQLATALAILRARGLGAEESATGIARIFMEIWKNTEKWQAAVDATGVSIQLMTAEGELAFDEFVKALGALTETEEGQILLTETLGTTRMRAMKILTAFSVMSDEYADILGGVGSAQGYVEKMSEKQRMTMGAMTRQLQATFTNAFLTYDAMNMMGDAFNALKPSLEALGESFAEFVFILLTEFVSLAPHLSDLIASFSDVLLSLIPVIKGLVLIGRGLLIVLNTFAWLLPSLIVLWITYHLWIKINTIALGINKMYILAHTIALRHQQTAFLASLIGIKTQSLALITLNKVLTWTNVLTIALMGAMMAISLSMIIGSTKSEELKNRLRVLQTAIIGITGFIVGLKVAMWLYGLAATNAAIAQHQLLIPIVGGAIAAVAIGAAIWYATSEMEKMTAEMEKEYDVVGEVTDTTNDLTSANYDLADSFGAASSFGREYYETFLLLTEATEGYIYTMGRVISPAPAMPSYEYGGIVPGPVGMPVPIIAHGGEPIGERYVGREKGVAGGAGVTIIFKEVHIHEEADLTRFAKRIGKEVIRGVA